MDLNKRQQLESLRSEILGEVVGFVESSELDPSQKFSLLIASARVSDEPARYRAAYQAALQIQDVNVKADALLELLDAIEFSTVDARPTADLNPSEPLSVPETAPEQNM
jgi:hypothetical protein